MFPFLGDHDSKPMAFDVVQVNSTSGVRSVNVFMMLANRLAGQRLRSAMSNLYDLKLL